jgi:ABC-type branched-subunit amino acid transport system substrate-binding protein
VFGPRHRRQFDRLGRSGGEEDPGVTAKQITIGATEPETGIAASGYNQVAKAANAVFKYVNARGGIYGRKIKYVIKDDCYGTPGFGCTGVPNTATQTHALARPSCLRDGRLARHAQRRTRCGRC